MQIRPWVMTAASTLIAGGALGVIVTATDPATARRELVWIVWAALTVGVWSLCATLLLWCRMRLSHAVWVALVVTILAVGTVAVRHYFR